MTTIEKIIPEARNRTMIPLFRFRWAVYPAGERILQQAFNTSEGFEWVALPEVILAEAEGEGK
jgi:hypothetical protein